ncbi:hypothetical protein AVEN_39105-1 [Araneus ventricosus]|uniref:Uncharacterized protein n=1 Tax=Araneus ventricosus TaxID=182803 RepID=A0A4Y2DEU1_ARAVE|nr:hypothetical protein AVEN_39105-1 [Araneus ventricosus]
MYKFSYVVKKEVNSRSECAKTERIHILTISCMVIHKKIVQFYLMSSNICGRSNTVLPLRVNLEFTVPTYFVPLRIAKNGDERTFVLIASKMCLTSDKRACAQIDPFIGVLLIRLYCTMFRLDWFVQLFDAIGR